MKSFARFHQDCVSALKRKNFCEVTTESYSLTGFNLALRSGGFITVCIENMGTDDEMLNITCYEDGKRFSKSIYCNGVPVWFLVDSVSAIVEAYFTGRRTK